MLVADRCAVTVAVAFGQPEASVAFGDTVDELEVGAGVGDVDGDPAVI